MILCKNTIYFLGRFLIIRSDKFISAEASIKARLYSPFYVEDYKIFCMIFRFNIWGNGTDGFRVYFEDYETGILVLQTTQKGPFKINKWHTTQFSVVPKGSKYFRVFLLKNFHSKIAARQTKIATVLFLVALVVKFEKKSFYNFLKNFLISLFLFKFIFEPFKGNNSEIASVSIDSIEFTDGKCGM